MGSNRRLSSTTLKHMPQRTCVGCRATRTKRELIRVVSKLNTGVEVDFSSKSPGRGAYLCPKQECWEIGLKKNRLGHALRIKLSLEDCQKLVEYSRNLPKGESS